MKELADGGYRVYALDLIGFGLGDKPAPGTVDACGFPVEYSFTYWSIQLREFIETIVRPTEDAAIYTAANSIGTIVTMQTDVGHGLFSGHVFISPSLRLLDVRKRTKITGIGANILQSILGINAIGNFFLNTLSKRDNLRSVLEEAYEAKEAIDDDLLDIISYPAKTRGALAVFQAFINLDSGPIPEDLIPALNCPALIIWGKQDTFEPIALGRALGEYDTIHDFVEIDNAGHCSQDEAPEIVNEKVLQFFNGIESESGK